MYFLQLKNVQRVQIFKTDNSFVFFSRLNLNKRPHNQYYYQYITVLNIIGIEHRRECWLKDIFTPRGNTSLFLKATSVVFPLIMLK